METGSLHTAALCPQGSGQWPLLPRDGPAGSKLPVLLPCLEHASVRGFQPPLTTRVSSEPALVTQFTVLAFLSLVRSSRPMLCSVSTTVQVPSDSLIMLPVFPPG